MKESSIMFNLMKTAILMAVITALFIFIGGLIGGRAGMAVALILALGMNFFSHGFSDNLVLRIYNAQEIDASSAPQYHRIVSALTANCAA